MKTKQLSLAGAGTGYFPEDGQVNTAGSLSGRDEIIPQRNYSAKESSRDEMNLAEFPLTVLSTRTNPNVKTLEFCDTQRLKTGQLIERKWIITGADKFGLPTATDDDVVLGLMRLTMDQGFRERKIYFTRYELLRALRWTTEGRSYSRLTKALDRLSGVRIRASNAFFDNTTKSYQTVNFGIIDAYEINDSRGIKSGTGEIAPSFFLWSEKLFESFRSGFIKKLDMDLYFSLKSAVSRRLYRYLDKHFYYKPVVEKNLMVLAFEKLGLSRNYKYISSIRQQLEPAMQELIDMGYLAESQFSGRGENTVVRFVANRSPLPQVPATSDKVAGNLENNNRKEKKPNCDALDSQKAKIIEALVSHGIALTQAIRLMEGRTESNCSQIRGILTYYESLVAKNDQRVSRNSLGFLYRAVEKCEEFVLPKTFAAGSSSGQVEQERPKRPELKVVKAGKRTKSTLVESRVPGSFQRYQEFTDNQLAEFKRSISTDSLSAMVTKVEERIICLKSVISEERYADTLKKFVNEELRKQAGLPDFKTWSNDVA